ncbi:hypothetical protein BDV97DRAFT_365561 [Delphinella strobiligena]|nr:hypothetical protein BDV97DRAFT_365561 [Delphinella strobiligena]
MALHRGIQSAIFYYLSCAPCTGYSYRKKRRKEAIKDRATKHQLEMDEPGLYRHPSPFATNPNWQTEIDLGPHPQDKSSKKSMQKKSRTQTGGTGGTGGGSQTGIASDTSLPLVPGATMDGTTNLRKFQREDEDLWGPHLRPSGSRNSALEGSVINGRALSRPATARTARTDKSNASYYSFSNPPINDLHPAIVTRLDNRDDAMWMLQPPPTARVMRGVDKPSSTRARSDSGSTKVSSRQGDYPPLARRLSQHIIDEKLKSGEQLPGISFENQSSPHPQTLSRDFPSTSSTDNLSSDDSLPPRRKRRPPPINVSEDSNDSERTIVPRSTIDSAVSGNLHPRRALSPIGSENTSSRPSARTSSRSPSPGAASVKTRHSTGRPALAPARQDSSLNVLQELVPATLPNVQKLSKSPSFEARIELPSPTSGEMELLGSGKAAFEDWYEARDFAQFPQWVSERTQREVTARWSVDF